MYFVTARARVLSLSNARDAAPHTSEFLARRVHDDAERRFFNPLRRELRRRIPRTRPVSFDRRVETVSMRRRARRRRSWKLFQVSRVARRVEGVSNRRSIVQSLGRGGGRELRRRLPDRFRADRRASSSSIDSIDARVAEPREVRAASFIGDGESVCEIADDARRVEEDRRERVFEREV